MKKQISTIVGVLIILFLTGVVGIVIFLCNKDIKNYTAFKRVINYEMTERSKTKNGFSEITINCEKEFDFVYNFGVMNGSTLDTRNNIYIKDMICEPSIEYEMVFTEQTKQGICNSILENNLLLIKDDFSENCNPNEDICLNVFPLDFKTLRIFKGNDKIKEIIYFGNYYYQDDPELKLFKNITRMIENTISDKEKELEVLSPSCGYM